MAHLVAAKVPVLPSASAARTLCNNVSSQWRLNETTHPWLGTSSSDSLRLTRRVWRKSRSRFCSGALTTVDLGFTWYQRIVLPRWQLCAAFRYCAVFARLVAPASLTVATLPFSQSAAAPYFVLVADKTLAPGDAAFGPHADPAASSPEVQLPHFQRHAQHLGGGCVSVGVDVGLLEVAFKLGVVERQAYGTVGRSYSATTAHASQRTGSLQLAMYSVSCSDTSSGGCATSAVAERIFVESVGKEGPEEVELIVVGGRALLTPVSEHG